jgi:predicted transcriptional regulator
VAEPAEGPEKGEPAPLGALTTEIVAAYVAKNAVAIAVLGHVIETVGRALAALGREEPKSDAAEPKAAVPVRRSIHDDHLNCLVCGKPQKTLRRHLDRAHHLTPEAYRERFGLRSDYPMSAPGYARQRSELAQRSGLGQRRQAPS